MKDNEGSQEGNKRHFAYQKRASIKYFRKPMQHIADEVYNNCFPHGSKKGERLVDFARITGSCPN